MMTFTLNFLWQTGRPHIRPLMRLVCSPRGVHRYKLPLIILSWILLYNWGLKQRHSLSITDHSSLPSSQSTVRSINLNALQSHLQMEAHSQNFYITKKGYRSRLQPSYFTDYEGIDNWQLATYYAAGEIARRYRARYLIDIGCGNGAKLAAFRNEFHLIGVDYGANVHKAREDFPDLTFVEADLDINKSCRVDLDPGLVSEAVVVSADVIEHLVDPLHCYVKLLKVLAEHALALVISTPDRERMAAVRIDLFKQNVVGPPSNRAHVREWVDWELELLLFDQGVYPLYSGQECSQIGACSRGFTVNTTTLTNQIHIIGNTQVRAMWLQAPAQEPQVIAFVIMDNTTNCSILDYNIHYLTAQGIKVVLVTRDTKTEYQNKQVDIILVPRNKPMVDVIQVVANSNRFSLGDWFVVMDAHEVISFPQSSAFNLTLRETLIRIGHEPYAFNAVAISTFFMQSAGGQPFSKSLPFKVFALDAWNEYPAIKGIENMWPKVDTLRHRVRIWRRGEYPVRLDTISTLAGSTVICGVHFVGRNVYPFHAQSLRFHPSTGSPYTWLEPALRRMYILETSIGYLARDRKKVATSQYLY